MEWKALWMDFLHDESGGERDTLTTLLILALIIIPLLLLLIFFGDGIIDFAREKWNKAMGEGEKLDRF